MQENAPRLPGGSKSASINQTLQTTLPEEQHTEEEEEDTKWCTQTCSDAVGSTLESVLGDTKIVFQK